MGASNSKKNVSQQISENDKQKSESKNAPPNEEGNQDLKGAQDEKYITDDEDNDNNPDKANGHLQLPEDGLNGDAQRSSLDDREPVRWDTRAGPTSLSQGTDADQLSRRGQNQRGSYASNALSPTSQSGNAPYNLRYDQVGHFHPQFSLHDNVYFNHSQFGQALTNAQKKQMDSELPSIMQKKFQESNLVIQQLSNNLNRLQAQSSAQNNIIPKSFVNRQKAKSRQGGPRNFMRNSIQLSQEMRMAVIPDKDLYNLSTIKSYGKGTQPPSSSAIKEPSNFENMMNAQSTGTRTQMKNERPVPMTLYSNMNIATLKRTSVQPNFKPPKTPVNNCLSMDKMVLKKPDQLQIQQNLQSGSFDIDIYAPGQNYLQSQKKMLLTPQIGNTERSSSQNKQFRFDNSSQSRRKQALHIQGFTDKQLSAMKKLGQYDMSTYRSILSDSKNEQYQSKISNRNKNHIKWKDFKQNTRNTRPHESSRIMNDKLILSSDFGNNDQKAAKSRLKLINQIGYGRVAAGGYNIQTDRLVFDSFTARSVGKEIDESFMNTNQNSHFDSKIVNSIGNKVAIRNAMEQSIMSAQIATEQSTMRNQPTLQNQDLYQGQDLMQIPDVKMVAGPKPLLGEQIASQSHTLRQLSGDNSMAIKDEGHQLQATLNVGDQRQSLSGQDDDLREMSQQIRYQDDAAADPELQDEQNSNQQNFEAQQDILFSQSPANRQKHALPIPSRMQEQDDDEVLLSNSQDQIVSDNQQRSVIAENLNDDSHPVEQISPMGSQQIKNQNQQYDSTKMIKSQQVPSQGDRTPLQQINDQKNITALNSPKQQSQAQLVDRQLLNQPSHQIRDNSGLRSPPDMANEQTFQQLLQSEVNSTRNSQILQGRSTGMNNSMKPDDLIQLQVRHNKTGHEQRRSTRYQQLIQPSVANINPFSPEINIDTMDPLVFGFQQHPIKKSLQGLKRNTVLESSIKTPHDLRQALSPDVNTAIWDATQSPLNDLRHSYAPKNQSLIGTNIGKNSYVNSIWMPDMLAQRDVQTSSYPKRKRIIHPYNRLAASNRNQDFLSQRFTNETADHANLQSQVQSGDYMQRTSFSRRMTADNNTRGRKYKLPSVKRNKQSPSEERQFMRNQAIRTGSQELDQGSLRSNDIYVGNQLPDVVSHQVKEEETNSILKLSGKDAVMSSFIEGESKAGQGRPIKIEAWEQSELTSQKLMSDNPLNHGDKNQIDLDIVQKQWTDNIKQHIQTSDGDMATFRPSTQQVNNNNNQDLPTGSSKVFDKFVKGTAPSQKSNNQPSDKSRSEKLKFKRQMREARNKPVRKNQVVVEPKKESDAEPLNLEIQGAFIPDEQKSKKKKGSKSKSKDGKKEKDKEKNQEKEQSHKSSQQSILRMAKNNTVDLDKMRQEVKVKMKEDRKKKKEEENIKIMKKRAEIMKDQEQFNPVSLLKSSRGDLKDSVERLENRDKSVTLILDKKKEKKLKQEQKVKINVDSSDEGDDQEERGRSKSPKKGAKSDKSSEKSKKSKKTAKSKKTSKSKKSSKSKSKKSSKSKSKKSPSKSKKGGGKSKKGGGKSKSKGKGKGKSKKSKKSSQKTITVYNEECDTNSCYTLNKKRSKSLASLGPVQPSQFFDSGTDPVDFFATRVLFDQTPKDKLDVENVSKSAKVPSLVRSKDWAKSRCLKLVMEFRLLSLQDKQKNFRTLEQIYLNPREIDIYTEEEAIYIAHVLRQRFETNHLNEVPSEDYEFKMFDIDQKARRTILVLTNFLLLGKHAHKDILDLLLDEELFIATTNEDMLYKNSIGITTTKTVQNLHYQFQVPYQQQQLSPMRQKMEPMSPKQNNMVTITDQSRQTPMPMERMERQISSEMKVHVDIDHNNVIKLLIRVRSMYQALSEVIHILELILQQREMFTNPDSILRQTVTQFLEDKKAGKDTNFDSVDKDKVEVTKKVLVKGQQVLQRLSRRIFHFLSDNKQFKSFIFLGINYQKMILKYSKILAQILRLFKESPTPRPKEKAQKIFQNPYMNSQFDFLEFSEKVKDVTLEEPIEELFHLFKNVKYFKDDTIILPFMNPDYGDGRYDGRFDNSEFFKDEIRVKLKHYLKEKNVEGLEKQRSSQEIANKQKYDQMMSEHKGASDMKQTIDMFNMDYDAGSMSISKGGFSHLYNAQKGAPNKPPLQGENYSKKQSQHQFEDAFNEFNKYYDASLIDVNSFKDSQSKINTDPSIKQLSNKIDYEDGVNPNPPSPGGSPGLRGQSPGLRGQVLSEENKTLQQSPSEFDAKTQDAALLKGGMIQANLYQQRQEQQRRPNTKDGQRKSQRMINKNSISSKEFTGSGNTVPNKKIGKRKSNVDSGALNQDIDNGNDQKPNFAIKLNDNQDLRNENISALVESKPHDQIEDDNRVMSAQQ